MGFHIPDSPPRSYSSSGSIMQGTASRSVSTGTSMESEGANVNTTPPPPTPSRRAHRRNAMIPILAIEAMGSPRMPHVGMTMDHRLALLQFQEQLRMRGLMGDESHGNKEPRSAETGMSGASGNGGAHGALPTTPADRLARLMSRHALPEQRIAQQLGWQIEQLQTYLAPEHRQHTAVQRTTYATPEMENAVVKLLVRYEIAHASSVVKRSSKTLLAPLALSMRRAHAAPQLARYMTDRRSILQPANTSSSGLSTTTAAYGSLSPGHGDDSASSQFFANHRKRKRRSVIKPLAAFTTSTRFTPSRDAVCPIRIDVDTDGVRYQDTLLLNSLMPGSSPEEIAAAIARDEKLHDNVRDAIAECIKRQVMAFASFIDSASESLHPIQLDIVIDGVALRDQFEWDIHCDLNSAESFAATLCGDLNLPDAFEPAIVFAIREQVYAYRRILFSKRWIGNDPVVAQKAAAAAANGSTPAAAHPLGISTLEPVEGTVVREPADAVLWQPVLSELGKDEQQYLTTKISGQRRSMTAKAPVAPPPVANGRATKQRVTPKFRKEIKFPRPINPFIMYCQTQKDFFAKTRRSASESRKIMGDLWRKMTDEDKEYYAQLTEGENEKRRREHVFEVRDRLIGEWEEDEARRVGLLGSGVLDASTEHVRGLLLANYINERHEVDINRPVAHAAEEEEEKRNSGSEDDDDGHGSS